MRGGGGPRAEEGRGEWPRCEGRGRSPGRRRTCGAWGRSGQIRCSPARGSHFSLHTWILIRRLDLHPDTQPRMHPGTMTPERGSPHFCFHPSGSAVRVIQPLRLRPPPPPPPSPFWRCRDSLGGGCPNARAGRRTGGVGSLLGPRAGQACEPVGRLTRVNGRLKP